MKRRLLLAVASLALIAATAACQRGGPGAGGSDSPFPEGSAAESSAAPTPIATTGTDYGY